MSNLLRFGVAVILMSMSANLAGASPATAQGVFDGFVPLPRNIFLKDRLPPARPPQPPPPPARPIEESLVLRGIVHNNDRYVVFVEDMKNSRMLKLGVCDRIGHGIIGQITIDSIDYLSHDEHTLVLLGSNFMGSATIPSRRMP